MPLVRTLLILTSAALPFLTACPGSLDSADPPSMRMDGTGGTGGSGGSTASVCDAPKMVFGASCDGAACHGVDSFLDLVSAGVENRLLGAKSLAQFPPCDGQRFVNAKPPLDGVLYKRMKGTECDRQMPPPENPNMPLPSNAIECLNSWVTAKMLP